MLCVLRTEGVRNDISIMSAKAIALPVPRIIKDIMTKELAASGLITHVAPAHLEQQIQGTARRLDGARKDDGLDHRRLKAL